MDSTNLFHEYDKRGVRAFVMYDKSNGKFRIECYRKKQKHESEGNHDWQMIRVGHTQSYFTRAEAEEKVLELAYLVCVANGY